MPVHHVVARAGQHRPAQRRVAQKGEPLGAVGIVLAALAVDAFAVEIAGLVDEDDADAGGGDRKDAGVQLAVSQSHRDAPDAVAGGDPAVTRHHDLDIVPQARQRLRQGPQNVGQAPGFRERGDFRGHHQDPHRQSTLLSAGRAGASSSSAV